MSLFGSLGERVRQGLRRTRELMDEGLGAILAIARPVDDAMLEELEETLIAADLGAAAASAFAARFPEKTATLTRMRSSCTLSSAATAPVQSPTPAQPRTQNSAL